MNLKKLSITVLSYFLAIVFIFMDPLQASAARKDKEYLCDLIFSTGFGSTVIKK